MRDGLEAMVENGVTRVETRAQPRLRVPVLNPWSPGDGKCQIVMLWSPQHRFGARKAVAKNFKKWRQEWDVLSLPVFLPNEYKSCRGALGMSSFPSPPPAASGFLSPPKAPCGKELVHRHCPFLLVEKRSSCFMVAWRLQSCLLPGLLLQWFQQSAWLQGEHSGLPPLCLTLQLLSSLTWTQHQHRNLWEEPPAQAQLLWAFASLSLSAAGKMSRVDESHGRSELSKSFFHLVYEQV